MSTLSFEYRPSEESNDHEIRILVDGRDFLGNEYLGLDPPEFFAQFNTPTEHLLIGRCTCGVVGCGDYRVSVRRSESIEWILADGAVVRFDADKYDRTISAAAKDHSWETQGRRVERLIGAQLAGMVTTDGHHFDWASTRFKPGALTLHFVKDKGMSAYAYRLVDISWDGRTEESALQAAHRYVAEHCA